MGGFGDFLGKAIAGAAEGYGKTLIAEGERKQKDIDSAKADQRAMALAKFNQQIGNEDAARDQGYNIARIEATGTQNRLGTAVELQGRAAAAAAQQAAELANWKEKNKIEYDQTVAVEGLKAANTIAEIKARAAAEGFEKVSENVNEDGFLVIQMSDGHQLKTITTTVKPKQKADDGGSGGVSSYRPTPTATTPPARPAAPAARTPSPAPASSGPKNDMERELQELPRLYESATPQTAPGLFRNGKKIPIETVRKQIVQSYGN